MLGVSRDTVIRWIEQGLPHGSQVTPGAPWRVQVSEKDRRRLTAAGAPEGWLPLRRILEHLNMPPQRPEPLAHSQPLQEQLLYA